MNIENLTLRQIREIQALNLPAGTTQPQQEECGAVPVLVSTDQRGVIFGYTKNPAYRPIILTGSRMCLYWTKDVGGMWGLAEGGPTKGCKISARVEGDVMLEGVVSVLSVDPVAEKAWNSAPVQGR